MTNPIWETLRKIGENSVIAVALLMAMYLFHKDGEREDQRKHVIINHMMGLMNQCMSYNPSVQAQALEEAWNKIYGRYHEDNPNAPHR